MSSILRAQTTENDASFKWQEFYSWLFVEDPEEYVGKNETQTPNVGLWAIRTIASCTNNFTTLSQERLIHCLTSSSKAPTNELVEAMRILTNTSKMNFQTFFLMRLVEKGFLRFVVAPSNRGKLTLKVEDNRGKIHTRPTHASFSQIIKIQAKIAEECVGFFCDRGLIKILESLKPIYLHEGGRLIVDLCSHFAQKGPSAEKRGEFAETIIHQKFSSWGLRPGIDFNTTDISLLDVVSKKIKESPQLIRNAKELTSRLEKEKTTRRLDIVIPLQNPLIVSQNVFYTSNTGGIAAKKADDVLNTKRILDEYLPNRTQILSFFGLIDGQGWIDMVSSLRKCFNNFDDFFQLKTVDTKLRKLLKKKGFLAPLDVEIEVFRCSEGKGVADKDSLLLSLEKRYPNHIMDLTELVNRTVRLGILKQESNNLVISKGRDKIVKTFHLLDIMLSDGFKSFSQKLDSHQLFDLAIEAIDDVTDVFLDITEVKRLVGYMNKRFVQKTFVIS